MIDEPRGTIYGGSVAAPVFKEIVERSLVQLGLPQKKETLQFAKARRKSPASEEADAIDVRQVVESALREEPQLRTVSKKGYLVVPLDSAKLPDFTGMSVREVARQCSRIGVKLKVIGAGQAVAQRPQPGAVVYRDTGCEVFFNFRARARKAPGARTPLDPGSIAAGN